MEEDLDDTLYISLSSIIYTLQFFITSIFRHIRSVVYVLMLSASYIKYTLKVYNHISQMLLRIGINEEFDMNSIECERVGV
jgi:hypothetical protein